MVYFYFMINNNLTIDSPDHWRHKNVLKVVSGSEFLRSIFMRDILTPILPSFFLECHGLNGFHQNLYFSCQIIVLFYCVLVQVVVCTILLSAKRLMGYARMIGIAARMQFRVFLLVETSLQRILSEAIKYCSSKNLLF